MTYWERYEQDLLRLEGIRANYGRPLYLTHGVQQAYEDYQQVCLHHESADRKANAYLQPSDLNRMEDTTLLHLIDLYETSRDELWDTLQLNCPRVDIPERDEKPTRRNGKTMVVKVDVEIKPKQAQAVADALILSFAGKGPVSQKEIDLCMLNAKRDKRLKTKQDPSHIYMYYKRKLITAGVLVIL